MNKIIKVYKTNQKPVSSKIVVATSYYLFNNSIAKDLNKIALHVPIRMGEERIVSALVNSVNLYFLLPSQQTGCFLKYTMEGSKQLAELKIESFREKIPEQLEQIIDKYNFKLEENRSS